MKKWLWISGWAVAPEWLAAQARAAWPDGAHAAARPFDAAEAVSSHDHDVLCGYSLGAWWLLRHAGKISAQTSVLLFAPIFSFCSENNCGGKVARARLRQQRRHFRRAPAAGLAEFARHAGLEGDSLMPPGAADAETALLEEELGWLEEPAPPAPPPAHWRGWTGGDDPLLDAARLRGIWPALRVVPGAGHAPGPLFHFAAQESAP